LSNVRTANHAGGAQFTVMIAAQQPKSRQILKNEIGMSGVPMRLPACRFDKIYFKPKWVFYPADDTSTAKRLDCF
jgi:hypothetical protein